MFGVLNPGFPVLGLMTTGSMNGSHERIPIALVFWLEVPVNAALYVGAWFLVRRTRQWRWSKWVLLSVWAAFCVAVGAEAMREGF